MFEVDNDKNFILKETTFSLNKREAYQRNPFIAQKRQTICHQNKQSGSKGCFLPYHDILFVKFDLVLPTLFVTHTISLLRDKGR